MGTASIVNFQSRRHGRNYRGNSWCVYIAEEKQKGFAAWDIAQRHEAASMNYMSKL